MNRDTEPLLIYEQPVNKRRNCIFFIITLIFILVILGINIYIIYALHEFKEYFSNLGIPTINSTEVSLYIHKLKKIADYVCDDLIQC